MFYRQIIRQLTWSRRSVSENQNQFAVSPKIVCLGLFLLRVRGGIWSSDKRWEKSFLSVSRGLKIIICNSKQLLSTVIITLRTVFIYLLAVAVLGIFLSLSCEISRSVWIVSWTQQQTDSDVCVCVCEWPMSCPTCAVPRGDRGASPTTRLHHIPWETTNKRLSKAVVIASQTYLVN